LKILFIDQISTVNNKYSFSIVKRLKENDEVIFITDEKKYYDVEKCYDYFKGTTDKNISKIEKGINYIRAWQKICKLCKEEKVDVLHVQWFILSPVDSFYIKKIKKIVSKVIVTVHDILPFDEKFYDFRSHKVIYSLADKIIVQAKPNIERINNMFEGISDKVVYIPHGNFIDEAKKIEKERARELLKIDKDEKVILFFGQIKKVKGLDILIEAFNKLILDGNDNIRLLIAGKVWGDDFSRYEKIIKEVDESKIRCDIKYIPDDEISWYYSASDINVLPYREVFQSGVVHLSYGYETPVIATNVGSFPEVIINGETGVLVEKDNVEALKNAIKEIIYDDEKINSMGKLGRKYIEENFSWDNIVEDIREIYIE